MATARGIVTNEGVIVSPDEAYAIIAEHKYGKLSKEETYAFLKTLKDAGEVDKIQTYFANTLMHPYLCRSSADKEALEEGEYADYYYKAIAIREINSIGWTFANLYNSANVIAETLYAESGVKLDTAIYFVCNAQEMRERLPEDVYKASVLPSLVDMAKGVSPYIVYTEKDGKEDFYVDVSALLAKMQETIKRAASLHVSTKTFCLSVFHTIQALEIDKFIGGSIQDEMEEAIDASKRLSINHMRVIKALEKYLDGMPWILVNVTKEDLQRVSDTIQPYENTKIDEAAYTHNLASFAGNTTYIIDKIRERTK